MSIFIFVDVEAYGISPINGRMTEFGAVDRKTGESFHGVLWVSKPDPDNPAKSLPTEEQAAPIKEVMQGFTDWLYQLGKDRPVFISDNPAYDFQWINCAFDEAGLDNPFGHSGRRISDFWAGVQRNWGDTQSWKRYRFTPHDHNPVNDARGNAEAFNTILEIMKSDEEHPHDK